ncbi:hypothetical protein DMENIID0001_169440 [Sergentomyia squamirostris]
MTSSSNNNDILAILPEMLSGQKFVDVTLAVEGRRIQCHRVILAAYSSYFFDLLEENPTPHPIIIFSGEIRFWMIEALIKFMYQGEVSVGKRDFADLVRCARTLKIQGFDGNILPQFANENQESENSLTQEETAGRDDLDMEDTELSELVQPQVVENEPIGEIRNSEESPLMNGIAESDLEMLNLADVEPKKRKLRQQKSSQNYNISGEMETEDTSDPDCESHSDDDETENSSRKKKKIDKMPFGPPPEDFVIPGVKRKRFFDKNTMWSALMSVKNGMSINEASQKFNINTTSIREYMKRLGIKSHYQFKSKYQKTENSQPQPETAAPPAAEIEQEDEVQMDDLDEEDTELNETVLPTNQPQEAESVPEVLNPADVVPKKRNLRQRKTLPGFYYKISGGMETENASMDSEDETENTFWKKKKIDIIPFVTSPEDFVLPPCYQKRSFDKYSMWSALMSIKNGMSVSQASQEFNINTRTIRDYMKKFGIKSQFKNQNQETKNSHPQPETAAPPAAETKEELNDEVQMDNLDEEDTELNETVLPTNQPQEAENEPRRKISSSGESPFMNRSAESVPEMLNPADVERNPNYRISGEMETENASMDSEDAEAENSSRKKTKMPFGPPPEDFVLLRERRQRSFDRNSMWSALMSIKNGMSINEASWKFNINTTSIRGYMKKFGIVSL